MSKAKQGSSSVKLKPEGLWSEVLSEHVRLTIKTFSAMQVKSLAMRLSSEVKHATIVQHTRTSVYIDYLRAKGGKRRQRDIACLGVLLPFSQQQLAIDFILDPGTEVTLSVKGPHFYQLTAVKMVQQQARQYLLEPSSLAMEIFESGPSNDMGKGSNSAGPSILQHSGPTRSLSRARSTASVDQYAADRAFSLATGGRRQSFDSTLSNSYHDAYEEPRVHRQGGFNEERSSTGPMDKRPRRS